ncbi:hypothetical protein EV715DRAFT_208265 [Schizophyllum commune]
MLQCVVIKFDRNERGKGLRNFKYPPDLVQLALNISMKSASAYEMLQEHVQIPQLRMLKNIQAKQPRLPIGLQTSRGAELVLEYFVRLRYYGPVALSCDDTKVLCSLNVYFDNARQCYFVIGHTGEEIPIADPAAFRGIIPNLTAATKLRLWVVRATGVPSIPSVIVAALPITNLDADALADHSWTVLQLLWERSINVVSYACDGASVERRVQGLLKARASYFKTYTLPHPGAGCANLEITVAHYGSNVLAFIQDPKHALKTARNNVYSGARALLLPNHLVTLNQLWQVFFEDGPLFARDVKRPDKQDDNAGSRFGNSDTLEWLVKTHPEHRGLIVYLFVFGEFIDAYQSRTIPIHERVLMVTRGMFFLDVWEKFLERGCFPRAQHFISHEAKAIMRILYHGFMEALFIYRDNLSSSGRHPPFCPWLFGSDACEHVFGLCRQMVMDFTILDFWYMLPKLFLMLRRYLSHRNTDSRATASGYQHTALFDFKNLDMHMLSDYSQVSDAHLAKLTLQAFDEVSSLFEFLGASVEEIYLPRDDALPGFATGAWDMDTTMSSGGPTPQGRHTGGEEDDYSEGDDELEGDESEYWDSDLEMDEEEMRDAKAAILRKMEKNELPPSLRKRVADLTYAEAGLETERRAMIEALPDVDDEEEEDVLQSERSAVADALRASEQLSDNLPAVDLVAERSNPFQMLSQASGSIDLKVLVSLREKHQTPEAARASRTRAAYHRGKDVDSKKKRAATEHYKLIRAYAQIAREHNIQSDSTGAQRKLRWTGTVKASGNSQNAAKAADAAASKVSAEGLHRFYWSHPYFSGFE